MHGHTYDFLLYSNSNRIFRYKYFQTKYRKLSEFRVKAFNFFSSSQAKGFRSTPAPQLTLGRIRQHYCGIGSKSIIRGAEWTENPWLAKMISFRIVLINKY